MSAQFLQRHCYITFFESSLSHCVPGKDQFHKQEHRMNTVMGNSRSALETAETTPAPRDSSANELIEIGWIVAGQLESADRQALQKSRD